jgi:hypothetical protein
MLALRSISVTDSSHRRTTASVKIEERFDALATR